MGGEIAGLGREAGVILIDCAKQGAKCSHCGDEVAPEVAMQQCDEVPGLIHIPSKGVESVRNIAVSQGRDGVDSRYLGVQRLLAFTDGCCHITFDTRAQGGPPGAVLQRWRVRSFQNIVGIPHGDWRSDRHGGNRLDGASHATAGRNRRQGALVVWRQKRLALCGWR
jgi:hypothetical protein